ncbi:HAMP domain-containing sensor histidine kinase [Chondromyces apiculatus]|uniref:histidine kinase n=1 Tax=Chondromyces apiculatus DSM 436 TaxID=1192034 RepID=A0A017T3X6_9BACT|nr:HAMP domain-containing sensor histidine kinase [Chondromyces apiculatus]EYF03943.1 Hypothetical protein CAP_5044 [Chondromyces apiculatus DSM 436]
MTVVGRISFGVTVALIALVGVTLWLVARVDELARLNVETVEVQVAATDRAAEARRLVDPLESISSKYLVSRDPAYAERAEELEDALSRELTALDALPIDAAERAAEASLQSAFKAHLAAFGVERLHGLEGTPERVDALEASLDTVRQALAELTRSSRRAMTERSTAALARSEEAARLSFAAAAVALLGSLAVLAFLLRTVSRPLRALVAGTRAVSAGDFSTRIDVRSRDELAHLARAFNAMVSELEQLERLKSSFVSHISHELKTPLVGMIETNQLLLDEVLGPLDDRQRRMLDLQLSSARRLEAMISDLLDASAHAAGLRYVYSAHDLRAVVQRAAAVHEARAHNLGVRLTVTAQPDPIPVLCDADRIAQVVQNLVDNALKVTPRDGTLDVTADTVDDRDLDADLLPPGAERPRGRFARITVRDTGPGLPDDERRRIFDRFARGRHAARGSGAGVGLGLAICRDIVSAHRGFIGATSPEAGGAEFTVILPLHFAGSVPPRSLPALTAAGLLSTLPLVSAALPLVSAALPLVSAALPLVSAAALALGATACTPPAPRAVLPGDTLVSRGDLVAARAAYDRDATTSPFPEERAHAAFAAAMLLLHGDPDDPRGAAREALYAVEQRYSGTHWSRSARIVLDQIHARAVARLSLREEAARRAELQLELTTLVLRSDEIWYEMVEIEMRLDEARDERGKLLGEMALLRGRLEKLQEESDRVRGELDALKRIDLRRRP